MNETKASGSVALLGPNDPPVEFQREGAAFAKERERLLRDHHGKIALIHEDEVVGVFTTADEALHEGYRRFGLARLMIKEIRSQATLDFVSLVDVHHPAVRLLNEAD